MVGHTYAKTKKSQTQDLYHTLYTKINSLWIIDLNVRARPSQTWNKREKNLHDLGIGKDFLDFLGTKNMIHKRKKKLIN